MQPPTEESYVPRTRHAFHSFSRLPAVPTTIEEAFRIAFEEPAVPTTIEEAFRMAFDEPPVPTTIEEAIYGVGYLPHEVPGPSGAHGFGGHSGEGGLAAFNCLPPQCAASSPPQCAASSPPQQYPQQASPGSTCPSPNVPLPPEYAVPAPNAAEKPSPDYAPTRPVSAEGPTSATASVSGTCQVICVTADKKRIPVDNELLRLSHVFDRMHGDLNPEEHKDFVFPLRNVHSRVFRKAVVWPVEHKGRPNSIIQKDPITQEHRLFAFSVFDRGRFEMPVPELIELVNAANFLDIPGLYHSGCQATAALIEGKGPVDVRLILQQWADLSLGDYVEIRDRKPWPDPRTVVHDPGGEVSIRLDIPNDVLIDVCEKLARADLERLQMVNAHHRNVIRGETLKGQRPRRHLREVVVGKKLRRHHFVRPPDGARIVCQDFVSLAKRIASCAVEKLM